MVMRVSLLIRSYNYARFLPSAIDSALNQTYPHVEVVVVDDGSTDESRDVIASYGDRVKYQFDENAGETSCLNAAFALSSGDILCLLDADDVFEPDKVAAVVAAARRSPQALLIHHQMRMIDAAGNPLHAPFPRHVPDGDIRASAMRAGGWFPRAVASALSFRRSYAERLFPIPRHHHFVVDGEAREIRVYPDTYLVGPAALVAPVAGIRLPLTRYRVHGSNVSLQSSPAESLVRYQMETRELENVMRTTFNRPVSLNLDRHLDYQLRLCAARRISRPRTAARIITCSSVPVDVRLREVARIATNRGASRR